MELPIWAAAAEEAHTGRLEEMVVVELALVDALETVIITYHRELMVVAAAAAEQTHN
jgi:hypothetical protein